MTQRTLKASKAAHESVWRDRLARYASSDQSIDAFCQSESISSTSFYGWRSRLRAQDAAPTAERKAMPEAASFIDLGPLDTAASANAQMQCPQALAEKRPGIEVRLDLGDGVLLTIARR